MKETKHRFVEHTGELELHAQAPDMATLFAECARALADVMAEDASGAPTLGPERVKIVGRDPAALLVEWLNELVFRSERNKCVYGEVKVEHVDDAHLEATIRGREPRAPRTAVKAATWHRLRVDRSKDGVTATVVLDV